MTHPWLFSQLVSLERDELGFSDALYAILMLTCFNEIKNEIEACISDARLIQLS